MACAVAIQSQLAPCNALDMWRLADCYTLPALEKVAVEAALRGFGELPPWSATGAQVLALVQTDSLVAKSEKAVFQLVVAVVGGRRAARGRAARGGDEARASCGDERGFVEGIVQPWLALVSIDDVALDYVVVDQLLTRPQHLFQAGQMPATTRGANFSCSTTPFSFNSTFKALTCFVQPHRVLSYQQLHSSSN